MTEKQILRHGLNGNQLKLIAVVSMLCDHAAIRLLAYGLIPALYAAGEEAAAERWNQVFWILRSVGRMAFPIYVFLLTEGFCHTRNRRRYALRLGVFALISEIPFDLLVYGKIWDTHSQNVFFTLFLAVLMLTAVDCCSGAVPADGCDRGSGTSGLVSADRLRCGRYHAGSGSVLVSPDARHGMSGRLYFDGGS